MEKKQVVPKIYTQKGGIYHGTNAVPKIPLKKEPAFWGGGGGVPVSNSALSKTASPCGLEPELRARSLRRLEVQARGLRRLLAVLLRLGR